MARIHLGRKKHGLPHLLPVAHALHTSLDMNKDTNTTDALELLISQHEEVEMLIEKIEDSSDPSVKGQLFERLADQLAAHATIEEKLFYPAVMAGDTRELLLEAAEEHLSVKRLLADMMELDPDDERFDAKLLVLRDQVSHHAHEEEEDELFPKVRRMFDADDLAALGNEMLAMFERLLEQGDPRRSVPAETREAAAL